MKLTGTNWPGDLTLPKINQETLTKNLNITKISDLIVNSQLSAGAFGGGATPVPIPNTEVKSPCAYGTAGFPGGRVGQCRHSIVGMLKIAATLPRW